MKKVRGTEVEPFFVEAHLKFKPKDRIAGLPAGKVIRLLQSLGRADVDANDRARHILGLDYAGAAAFLGRLEVEEGLIEAGGDGWRLTEKGIGYSQAEITDRLKRDTADAVVAELADKAAAINGNDKLAHRIERVSVFGSFLSEKERLGDVDVAVDMLRRLSDPRAQYELLMSRREGTGRNPTEHAAFASNEVLRAMKKGRKGISLHAYTDVYLLGLAIKTVYLSPRLVESAAALKRFFEGELRIVVKGEAAKRRKVADLISLAVTKSAEFATAHPFLKDPDLLRAAGHQMALPDWEHHHPAAGFIAVQSAATLQKHYPASAHLVELIEKTAFDGKDARRAVVRLLTA